MKRITRFLLAFCVLLTVVISTGYVTYQQDKKIDAPVTKETAAAIATMFAGLKEVIDIRQPRVIYSHTQIFNVMGNDGKGDILIGIDPSTGEVIKMVKQCPYPGIDTEDVKISGEQAVGSAQEFLSKRGLPQIPEGFLMEEPKLKTTWRKKHWEIIWHHYIGDVQDVQILSSFISFIVSAETGEIVSYSKVHHDVQVPYQPELSADEGIEKARGVLGEGTLKDYDPSMKVLRTTLKIIYPNNYFKDFVYHWSDRQALAWIVQFKENEEPAIDVWIDALSGELLGGEIYERPVPELWGIPDQTSDITSYPGWEPALDIMQYDTSNTFLGDANETDIVNSIANGEYFVLQTHGSTTTTAEYARICHSGSIDQQRLIPEEIPENNLRYALMSFCHSAHDGTGQDFKDVFIDLGSDVFHGYVESINPDHYERELLRYLAEGQNLWNAHWNAVADVNPWFTIVIEYGPPLYCYNQLRLAPLLVGVSATSPVWHTATITATISNREDARHTIATNVMAELKLPSGFSIISGFNPQTTSALNWNHNWIAYWKVHAPFMTFGTRTFDVEVWSDNLGVEVDDFSNPYHKVDVKFKYYLVVVLNDYLELVKWWELAVLRYQQFPEPKHIMSISKDLDRYRTADDVQKDPSQFLRLMISMTKLELGFGNHFVELGKIAPEVIREYMEIVEGKMAYLKQLQEEGLRNVKKALTDLSAMQMRINAAALKAFWKQ